jgi:methyl-accepting chemotaxis protein
MNTYYYVASALSGIPEAYTRLMNVGNLIRKSLYEAEGVVTRWNSDLAAAQAQGRRLSARPFDQNPRDITMNMLVSSDLQIIRNSRPMFDSDRERINNSLTLAMNESKRKAGDSEELERYLERYLQSAELMTDQYGRMTGFNVANPCTVSEFFTTLSQMNGYLCQLWAEEFNHMELQVKANTATARLNLFLYLAVVLVSLGLAIAFVVFITRDINSSVKSLNTLFKGLNENDLTLSLQTKSKDEFGELMTAFNGFLHILRSTF